MRITPGPICLAVDRHRVTRFEPKFSLTPLAFGTLKAALYAMLFALPLALMGAAYTAYFMSPLLRRMVQPRRNHGGVADRHPGFPRPVCGSRRSCEENLAGVMALMLVMPVGLLLFAWFWTHAQWRIKDFLRGLGTAFVVAGPGGLGLLSLEVVGPLQDLFFDGDLRTWLSREAGISYDQRNAMVVGIAMGFAVIPTIFSIAEDAMYGVPKSLSDGSLALGATPWQSLVRVVCRRPVRVCFQR